MELTGRLGSQIVSIATYALRVLCGCGAEAVVVAQPDAEGARGEGRGGSREGRGVLTLLVQSTKGKMSS